MTRRYSSFPVALAALLVLAARGELRLAGQEHIGQRSQTDVVKGSQLYKVQCAVCHGLAGNGVGTVDLQQGRFRTVVSDEDLKRVIRAGIPAAGMPPSMLEDNDLAAIAAFIRSGMDATGNSAAIPMGDAARGKAIFDGAKGACLTCHRVKDEGGRSAPDLSDIGSMRPVASLQMSLLDPTSAMMPINRPVRAVTRDGKVISGRRLNEDTYVVLLSDQEGRLVALTKADLREYEVLKTSPMPSYSDTLTPAELADVLAYVASLKGPGRGAP